MEARPPTHGVPKWTRAKGGESHRVGASAHGMRRRWRLTLTCETERRMCTRDGRRWDIPSPREPRL